MEEKFKLLIKVYWSIGFLILTFIVTRIVKGLIIFLVFWFAI